MSKKLYHAATVIAMASVAMGNESLDARILREAFDPRRLHTEKERSTRARIDYHPPQLAPQAQQPHYRYGQR